MAVADGPRAESTALPIAFKVWAGAAWVSQLGDAAVFFAVGWAAAAHGGAAAGLVLSMVALPRTVLLLLGGAVGDRAGVRRVMLVGDGVMFVVAVVLAVAAWRFGTPLVLLIGAAVVIGTNDAFYLPAAGSMPRILVDADQVARAVALRQSGAQLVAMAGAPLGGVLVAYAGVPVAAAADAATFAVVFAVLWRIRPRFTPEPPAARQHILREAADGVGVALRTPGLRGVLCLMAGSAGFVLPVSSLLVPLLARSNAWPVSAAGLVVGAQSAGTIAVTLVVARRGTTSRPAVVAAVGLTTVCLGLLCLAWSPSPVLAAVSGLCCGSGVGLLVSHMTPLLVTVAPTTHLARVQALFTLTQSLALLVTNNLLGPLGQAYGPQAGLAVCAAFLATCACAALFNPVLRDTGRQSAKTAG